MEKNLEKRKKFNTPEEYRHHYMAVILKQVQDSIPMFVENYTKSLMRYYGIHNKYLPPNFRAQKRETEDYHIKDDGWIKKEVANAVDAERTEGTTG